MDFSDYWPENKRFLVTVGSGLLVFLIGLMIVNNLYGSEVKSEQRKLTSNRRNLRDARYTPGDLSRAKEENEALQAAVDTLANAVTFIPREEFVLRQGGSSPGNQYFGTVDRVREELDTLASRNRLRLPDGLGLEVVKTQRLEVVQRHLEALDVIDRVVRLALEAGVRRIDKIQVRLDPGIESRGGVGTVERTEIKFTIIGPSRPFVRLMALSQAGRFGSPLPVHDIDVNVARSKADEVRAEVTFMVIRLHGLDEADEEI
ncbi:MAG: hypothetical protein E2O39_08170 [Planctomycetota bacterium]|nr:MAG: hypothetical protein E2O39_08170 [Planctomycetota bacterium]